MSLRDHAEVCSTVAGKRSESAFAGKVRRGRAFKRAGGRGLIFNTWINSAELISRMVHEGKNNARTKRKKRLIMTRSFVERRDDLLNRRYLSSRASPLLDPTGALLRRRPIGKIAAGARLVSRRTSNEPCVFPPGKLLFEGITASAAKTLAWCRAEASGPSEAPA